MKHITFNKYLKSVLLTGFIILTTATFAFAQLASSATEFPYFQFGCLVIGGLIVLSLKRKYEQMYLSEALGTFALYTLLISLFTNPVVEAIRSLI